MLKKFRKMLDEAKAQIPGGKYPNGPEMFVAMPIRHWDGWRVVSDRGALRAYGISEEAAKKLAAELNWPRALETN